MTEKMDGEVSLLDLLVIIAENWLLLVIVPVALAAATYAFLLAQNQTLRSQAILDLPPATAEALVTEVLEQGQYGEVLAAREAGGMVIDSGTGTATTQLQLTSDDQKAHEQFRALVDRIVKVVKAGVPEVRDDRIAVLESRLSLRDGIVARLETAAADLADDPIFDADAYASVVAALNTTQMLRDLEADKLATLRREDVTANDGQITLVDPVTGPQRVGRSPLLTAILTLLGSGFVLFVLVFIRAGVRGAMTNAESRQKLERITNALLLRKQPT